MGTQRYTITRGERARNVVRAAGGAVATNTVQVNVDFTASMTRDDVLECLRQVEESILVGQWPPAAP